jgi:hypothetical protein
MIVDQHDVPMRALSQKGEHGFHAWPVDQRAAFVIREGGDHLVATHLRRLATAGFLRGETVATFDLRSARDAGVDDGGLGLVGAHASSWSQPLPRPAGNTGKRRETSGAGARS